MSLPMCGPLSWLSPTPRGPSPLGEVRAALTGLPPAGSVPQGWLPGEPRAAPGPFLAPGRRAPAGAAAGPDARAAGRRDARVRGGCGRGRDRGCRRPDPEDSPAGSALRSRLPWWGHEGSAHTRLPVLDPRSPPLLQGSGPLGTPQLSLPGASVLFHLLGSPLRCGSRTEPLSPSSVRPWPALDARRPAWKRTAVWAAWTCATCSG